MRKDLIPLLALTVALASPAGALAPAHEVRVQRILTLLGAVGEDYREGVEGGRVVRPIELEEAKTCLDEAKATLKQVASENNLSIHDLEPQFESLANKINALGEVDQVAAEALSLRAGVSRITGIEEQLFPTSAPSAARGRQLFLENCARCHGPDGDGTGPDAATLNPKPANLADAKFIRGETPYDFFHVITLGKSKTAMPSWGDSLSLDQRWDLLSHIWTLSHGTAGIAEGQGIYLSQCANCHGATGNGQGAYTAVLTKPAPDLSKPQTLAKQADAQLFDIATHGLAGTPMPSFARTLSDDERWKAVGFLRLLSMGGPGGPNDSTNNDAGTPPNKPETKGSDTETALAASLRLVDQTVAAYQHGDNAAAGFASDGYFEFEPIEPKLGAVDATLKTNVEEHFLKLRQGVKAAGNDAAVTAAAAAIKDDFQAVRVALQPQASASGLFLQSAGIILREGFEMVLVISALMSWVIKTGGTALRRGIHAGVVGGIVMSIVTAFAMVEIRAAYPGSGPLLEGATMLLAAVVLFWVSYWLISKAEADRWHQYIRGKVTSAVGQGSSLALAGAAFLAVYREGFETVLFYQALYASAPAAGVTITIGLGAGTVALTIVYTLMRRFQVRIPMQQFFLFTGIFLYSMAAIFAGQGVHELQEATLISSTPVSWAPTLPLLGIFPSVETLAAQMLFVVLLLFASYISWQRSRAVAPPIVDDSLVGELRALRSACDGLSSELTRSGSSQSSTAVAALVTRVEQILHRVEHTAPAGSGH